MLQCSASRKIQQRTSNSVFRAKFEWWVRPHAEQITQQTGKQLIHKIGPVQKGEREGRGEGDKPDHIIIGFVTMLTHKEAILRFFHVPLTLLFSFTINCLMIL